MISNVQIRGNFRAANDKFFQLLLEAVEVRPHKIIPKGMKRGAYLERVKHMLVVVCEGFTRIMLAANDKAWQEPARARENAMVLCASKFHAVREYPECLDDDEDPSCTPQMIFASFLPIGHLNDLMAMLGPKPDHALLAALIELYDAACASAKLLLDRMCTSYLL